MDVTLFGDRVFADDGVKMKSYDLCPYEEQEFRHRDREAHRDDAM
jgi:ribosome modulation factor